LWSPLSAALGFKIFEAKCLGVSLSGAADGDAALMDTPVGCAHSGQNFADGDSWWPPFAHVLASGAAHSSQNFAATSLQG
jgi:hypothetical protein